MSTYLLLENPFTFTKLIKRLKIIQSNKDRDKIVTLSIAYSNLPILCVTLKYFINSIVRVKNVTAMENSYCYFLIVIFVSEVLKHYRDKICVAKWLKVLNLTMKQLKKHLTQQLNDQEVILFIIFLLFPSENWFFQAKNSSCLDFVTFWSKTDKVITFFFLQILFTILSIFEYDHIYWQILWSSYRKLTRVGFEPSTTKFRSDALIDGAVRSWVQLAPRANFIQPLQFHCLFSVTFHFGCFAFVSRHVYFNRSFL